MLPTHVYIRQIDVLRALAILIVCITHFLLFSVDGTPLLRQLDPAGPVVEALVAPVFLFFVISGILIPLTMLRDSYRLKDIHLFLSKRILRFYLPFIVVLLLILGVQYGFSVINQRPFVVDWQQLTANISLTADFQDIPWYNPIFWTLAIELQFYVLIALIYPLLRKYGFVTITALLIVGLTLTYFMPNSRYVWYYTPLFATGMAFFCFVNDGTIRSRWLVIAVALAGIIQLPVANNQFQVWIPLIGVLLLFGIPRVPRFISWISLVSYSLYLTHGLSGMMFLYLTRTWGDHWAISITRILLALSVTLLFGAVFYKYVESLAHRLSRAIRYSKTPVGNRRGNH